MNQGGALDNQLLTAFALALIVMGAGALAFLVKTWMKNLGDTMKELCNSIHDLTEVVNELKQEQAIHRLRLRQQTIEIRQLQANQCAQPECPNKITTNPGLIQRRRLDDYLTEQSGENEAFR